MKKHDARIKKYEAQINKAKIFISISISTEYQEDIYDYESSEVEKKIIKIIKPSILVKVDGEVLQLSSLSKISKKKNTTVLCHIQVQEHGFAIKECSEILWIVIKNVWTKYGLGYILKEGDIIRFGTICYKVSLIRSFTKILHTEVPDFEDFEVITPEIQKSEICRVCLCNDNEPSNPLINPCMCSGSVKYIHLQCLKQWFDLTMEETTTENCLIQSWVSSNCDICKHNYPMTVSDSEKEVELFKTPDPPFIILKSIGNDEGLAQSMHILSFNKGNKIVIGSGDGADFYIYDGSVSSCHATIKLVDECFIIEDCDSKFGTALYGGKKIVVEDLSTAFIQIGRNLLSFSKDDRKHNFDNSPFFLN